MLTKVKLQRLQCGIKQIVASKELGISQPYLSQLEAGDCPIDREVLIKMAKLYRCNVKELT